MVEATTHITTKSKRRGDILWDDAWCDACVAQHRATFGTDRGVVITVRPWQGEARACSACDDSDLAPELKAADPVKAELLVALKAMVASYDGLRDILTCKNVIAKLAAADAVIKKAEMVAVLALVLLVPGMASAQAGPQAAIITGNVLDAVSTEIALQRPGLREANPILGQSMPRRLAIKAAGTAAQVWVVRRMGKEHPKAAKVFGYAIGAWFGGVAVWNSSR